MSEKIAVVGAGTMGSGIAQIAVEAGFEVVIIDTDDAFIERGIGNIKKFIGKKFEKNKISRDDHDSILGRLSGTTDMAAGVADSVMVVEAVFENLELKKEIFGKLDSLCPADVILSSNTSTMSISKIAEATANPTRVIGTHYFSPVPLMKLVEIVVAEKTSGEVIEKTMSLCKRFGKVPISVKDVPGFIVNRFLCLMYNEAANMIYKDMAQAEDIDSALKLGCNWPMGICQIMDMAGVDITYNALQSLYVMTGEERYKPSPLFETMVSEKRLGQKTGRGFYKY